MKLRIEKVVYGGAGLAHIPLEEGAGPGQPSAGKTVFIPNTLPGELVEAHIIGDRSGYSTAEVNSILERSPERSPPGCEYFPRCGGCQYQHAGAPYQLQMKMEILEETLARAHVSASGIRGIPSEPWAYRNRIRLQLARRQGTKSGFDLCYRERGSHTNLPITHCPIAAPILNQAIHAVLHVGEEAGLASLCDEIEFFTNGEQNALLVSLFRNRVPSFTAKGQRHDHLLEGFAEALHAKIPALSGVGLFSNRLIRYWGESSLVYTVSGHAYQVSLGSFFQVNRFLLPELLSLVLGGRSGRLAWDLYSGAGLFARALDFENVIAVESGRFAVMDLEQNLIGTPHRAVHSNTVEFLRSQTHGKLRASPDLILLDPPRAGLGEEVCAHLGQIAARTIVYVSCDPATLARDLRALLRSGYSLQETHLIDLFPQTFHLETVVVLARNPSSFWLPGILRTKRPRPPYTCPCE